jgi:hypothetical protein
MKKNRQERRAEAAKARKQTPDPLKIFMNAERFRIANRVLRQVKDQSTAAAVGGPALIYSALASELYLKCLICLETGRREQGHELHELFKKLNPKREKRFANAGTATLPLPSANASTPQSRRWKAATFRPISIGP